MYLYKFTSPGTPNLEAIAINIYFERMPFVVHLANAYLAYFVRSPVLKRTRVPSVMTKSGEIDTGTGSSH